MGVGVATGVATGVACGVGSGLGLGVRSGLGLGPADWLGSGVVTGVGLGVGGAGVGNWSFHRYSRSVRPLARIAAAIGLPT
jgi:hypothetical protein